MLNRKELNAGQKDGKIYPPLNLIFIIYLIINMNSTKRTCITCTAKGVNTNRVPLWSKKDGLYSMLPKILNCDDTYNPNKHSLKKETPEITGTKLEAELHI